MTDMPFGVRHFSRSEGTYRVLSTYRAIEDCISSLQGKHIENPKDLYPVLSTKQKRDEFNRLSVEKSAFYILHS